MSATIGESMLMIFQLMQKWNKPLSQTLRKVAESMDEKGIEVNLNQNQYQVEKVFRTFLREENTDMELVE